MATLNHNLGKMLRSAHIAVLALLAVGCTDSRTVKSKPLQLKQVFANNSLSMTKIAAVRFNSEDTQVAQMVRVGNTVHMVGYPFAYAGWNIDAPETPNLAFDLASQLSDFPIKLPWTVDWYASGAVGIMGSTSVLSGTSGVSLINMTQPKAAKEIFRKPPLDAAGKPGRDFGYVYSAIVPHPTQAMWYGFSQQENVYTVAVGQNNTQIISTASYSPNGPVCCVKNAVYFSSTIYVAFGTRLAWFAPTQDGGLVDPGELSSLQATGVAVSDNYVIVHHNPTSAVSAGAANPKGFYYFDSAGNLAAYVPSNVIPRLFVADPSGRYLYMQVGGGVDVEVHRVQGL